MFEEDKIHNSENGDFVVENVTSNAVDVNDGGKCSYYVWFLGSKESKGLRGAEYIRPVARQLLERANDVKITLQVSSKGIKIVKGGSEASKQFVGHDCITSAMRGDPPHDDVVSAILLINSNGSKNRALSSDCPLFVHSYRCDSPETAEHLARQLKFLVERPENIAKFDAIESRLVEKGLILKKTPSNSIVFGSSASSKLGSDGRSLGGRSSDSGGSEPQLISPTVAAKPNDKLVTLYDSLAAELREKLDGKKGPLLLPPRDYDTMHRNKGDSGTQLETRRSLNPAIVGKNSSVSSGIGSSKENNPHHRFSSGELS